MLSCSVCMGSTSRMGSWDSWLRSNPWDNLGLTELTITQSFLSKPPVFLYPNNGELCSPDWTWLGLPVISDLFLGRLIIFCFGGGGSFSNTFSKISLIFSGLSSVTRAPNFSFPNLDFPNPGFFFWLGLGFLLVGFEF